MTDHNPQPPTEPGPDFQTGPQSPQPNPYAQPDPGQTSHMQAQQPPTPPQQWQTQPPYGYGIPPQPFPYAAPGPKRPGPATAAGVLGIVSGSLGLIVFLGTLTTLAGIQGRSRVLRRPRQPDGSPRKHPAPRDSRDRRRPPSHGHHLPQKDRIHRLVRGGVRPGHPDAAQLGDQHHRSEPLGNHEGRPQWRNGGIPGGNPLSRADRLVARPDHHHAAAQAGSEAVGKTNPVT